MADQLVERWQTITRVLHMQKAADAAVLALPAASRWLEYTAAPIAWKRGVR